MPSGLGLGLGLGLGPGLGDCEILRPAFVTKRSEGLFVETAEIGIDGRFLRFVENVFSVGAYFSGLEFANFNRLLYEMDQGATFGSPVRLAADIRFILPGRRDLYKAVRLGADGKIAEYMFAPVYLEMAGVLPPGESAGDGSPGKAGKNTAAAEPAKLDFDEFVAHLWVNGVRSGIDEAAVRRTIARGETGRLKVAGWIEPKAGRDAGIEEKNKSLHCDNSPRILQGGIVDLSSFKNHFPQVSKDELLVRKTPRALGVPGRKITGDFIEPEPPKDLDLNVLAGPGTRIEERSDGAYIVANMSGFVNFDRASNQISIAEKIVSRNGVSMRTTGNLKLSGDDYEEFGEVQERRTVEGKNMTLHDNVFGSIVSRGGIVLFEQNLVNGKASSPGGEIVVNGRASASVLEAPGGKIHVKHAEGCKISGADVIVESAIQCQIVGNRVEVGTAAGCIIAAQSVIIAVATVHRDRETVVTMLTPNLAANDKKQEAVRKRLAEIQAKIDAVRQEVEAIQGQKEFGSFLAFRDKFAKGEITITPAQKAGFLKVAARFGAQTTQLRTLGEAIAVLQKAHADVEGQLKALAQVRAAAGAEVECAVSSVRGDSVVRILQHDPDVDFLSGEGLQELIVKVRGLDTSRDRLFSGSSGSFSWQYKPVQERCAETA